MLSSDPETGAGRMWLGEIAAFCTHNQHGHCLPPSFLSESFWKYRGRRFGRLETCLGDAELKCVSQNVSHK